MVWLTASGGTGLAAAAGLERALGGAALDAPVVLAGVGQDSGFRPTPERRQEPGQEDVMALVSLVTAVTRSASLAAPQNASRK